MTEFATMLELNPDIDLAACRADFAEHRRVQVRNFLTEASALNLVNLLRHDTPWGLSWAAAEMGPHKLPEAQVRSLRPENVQALSNQLNKAMAGSEFAFIYGQYLAHDAAILGIPQNPRYDKLVSDINGDEFLGFARNVTQLPQISWADCQATHYSKGQFLSVHQDKVEGENRLVAFVINLCVGDWRPDWGGYLNFFDDEGDIICGYRPRFNSLNLFLVPQHHHVSYVPPFAPDGRLAITGWLRAE